MGISPDVIERLVRDPEQPIEAVMLEVYGAGVEPLLNALFDEAVRIQHVEPDRALACARVMDLIWERAGGQITKGNL